MRNKAYLFIICVGMVALLAGCGSTTEEEMTKVTAPAENLTATAVPKEPVEDVQKEEETATTKEDAVNETSTEADSSWEIMIESQMASASNYVGFFNDKLGISVGYAGAVSYTTDGAQTWTKGKNSSMCRFCLDIVDENIAWCGGNGNTVRVTKDGGKTWDAVTNTKFAGMHKNIDFIDDTTGWVCDDKACVATNDGGVTWNEISLPEDADGIASIEVRSAKDGYLLSNNGRLYVTSDGGATWQQRDIKLAEFKVTDAKGEAILPKLTTTIADMSFYDENQGMLVFAGKVKDEGMRAWCLTTQDGGNSWTSEALPLGDLGSINKVFLSQDGNYITLGDLMKKMEVLARK